MHLIPGLTIGKEVAVCILLGAITLVASAGGVEGGVINTSLLGIFGVAMDVAAPLSRGTILAGNFLLLLFNIFERLPGDPKQSGIQWDLVFILEPAVVLGSVFGGLIGATFPDWLSMLMNFFILLFVAILMVKKGADVLSGEKRYFKRMAQTVTAPKENPLKKVPEQTSYENVQLVNDDAQEVYVRSQEECTTSTTTRDSNTYEYHLPVATVSPRMTSQEVDAVVPAVDSARLDDTKDEELCEPSKISIPRESWKCSLSHFGFISTFRLINFMICIIAILGLQFVLFSATACSPSFWGITAGIIIIGTIAVTVNTLLIRQSIRKYKFMTTMLGANAATSHRSLLKACKLTVGDTASQFHTNMLHYGKLVAMGLLIGFTSTMLGVSTGILRNPVMIIFGIDPYIARLASMTMAVFTNFQTFVGYLLTGSMDIEYAWPVLLIVTVTFPLGYFVSNGLMREINTRAVIPFAIAIIMMIMCVFVGYYLIVVFIHIAHTGQWPGFFNYCQ